jgi:hypothetical protein
MSKQKEKEMEYESNPASGGNMGAGRSGREDLGSETSAENQGSHKPDAVPSHEDVKGSGDPGRLSRP